MKCEICERNFDNLTILGNHLKIHKMSSREYYDKYLKRDEKEGICIMYEKIPSCNEKTFFISMKCGYKVYCSEKCAANSEVKKEKAQDTNLKKYGVKNPNQNKNIKQKSILTNLEKYRCKNPFQNEEIKKKIKNTNLEKYGCDNPFKNPDIREKQKQTNLEKYGCENTFQNEEIKKKIKETNLKKYGVENPSQSGEINKKRERTFVDRFGGHPLKNKEIKEKIIQTNLKKYGVDNIFKDEKTKEKIKQIKMEKFILKFNKLLEYLNLELLSGYNYSNKLIKIKCKICGTIFETTYHNVYQNCGKCPNCFPKYRSNGEIELFEFLKSLNLNITQNDREIIKPQELDIYIPEKSVAIEFDGLYWHSEGNNKNRNYHLNKTIECGKNNIRLIHIFEDEWLYKQDIVKSKLKNILGLDNSERIQARKCIIKEISPNIKNEFLEKYHLQGKDTSIIKLGAFYNDGLISVMTFSHGNISKGSKNIKDVWELNRFCSNYNYHIPGIASKLLSYFKKNYEWKEIFSYADRRWSDGNLYYKLGFKLSHITKPNYWYTKSYERFHRYSFRKRKNDERGIPEWALRSKEGYFRIWDCGHLKFIMENK